MIYVLTLLLTILFPLLQAARRMAKSVPFVAAAMKPVRASEASVAAMRGSTFLPCLNSRANAAALTLSSCCAKAAMTAATWSTALLGKLGLMVFAPADKSLGFLGSAFLVQRHQPRQHLVLEQVNGSTICNRDFRIQLIVQFLEDENEGAIKNEFLVR